MIKTSYEYDQCAKELKARNLRLIYHIFRTQVKPQIDKAASTNSKVLITILPRK